MDDNNPNSSPEIHPAHVSRMYGILAPVGVVLLVATVMLLSYFFTNRHRTAARQIRISGAAAPSDRDTDEELGLDEASIIRFPILLYSQAAKNRSNSPSPPPVSPSPPYVSPSPPPVSPSSCSICLSNYEESDMVRILPECEHFFHVKCVDPWLKLNSTCPICRKLLIRHLPVTVSVTAG